MTPARKGIAYMITWSFIAWVALAGFAWAAGALVGIAAHGFRTALGWLA
jgi:hypothetical protein